MNAHSHSLSIGSSVLLQLFTNITECWEGSFLWQKHVLIFFVWYVYYFIDISQDTFYHVNMYESLFTEVFHWDTSKHRFWTLTVRSEWFLCLWTSSQVSRTRPESKHLSRWLDKLCVLVMQTSVASPKQNYVVRIFFLFEMLSVQCGSTKEWILAFELCLLDADQCWLHKMQKCVPWQIVLACDAVLL